MKIMNKLLEQLLWFGIAIGMNYSLTLLCSSMYSILRTGIWYEDYTALEVIQPSTGPVCPGQDAILTCTVARTGFSGTHLYLTWRLLDPSWVD